MTDQQLRDELHRIADSAPSAYIPADLFARGRRAHRRSLTIVAASVAAAVVLIAGAVALAPTRDSAEVDPARSRADLAVPDTIYATPTWLAETEDGRYTHVDDLEQDLAIGIGAIAYVQPAEVGSSGSVAVVVDADADDYHPLDLPDFIGLDPYWENSTGEESEHQPVALSPDGRHLAWAWGVGRFAGTDSQVTSGGVRIADLTTGKVSEWDLSTSATTYVSDLEWSEGSQQLLWVGSRMDRWDMETYVPDDPAAGVIHLASGSSTPYVGELNAQGDLSLWTVADDGAIAFNGEWDSSDIQLQQAGAKATIAVARPAESAADEPVIFHGSDLYAGTVDGLSRVDATGRPYTAPHALPLRPIGWVGAAPLVTTLGSPDAIDIGLLGSSKKDAEVLIDCDDAGSPVAATVSVAYTLVDADAADLTVHRGRPLFFPPWLTTPVFWLVAVGVAIAIWSWRRRRSAAVSERPARGTPGRLSGKVVVVAVATLLMGFLLGVMFISPTAFTPSTSDGDERDGLVTIPSVTSAAQSPSQAVIPRRIRWTDIPEEYVDVSSSLAVGRATLAFADASGGMLDGGSVVVITTDGVYHRLDLPDNDETGMSMDDETQSIRLSPDGLHLAYVTDNPGLNVIDLETGEVTEHPLELDGSVTGFSWSPNSAWLVWDSNYEHPAAGRITPGGTSEPLPKGRWTNAGIGNDGTVVTRTGSKTTIWPQGAADLPGTAQDSVSTWVGTGTPVDGVDDSGVRSIGWDSGANVDLALGRNPSVRGVDVDGRSLHYVAGWLADGKPLIVTSGEDLLEIRTVFSDGGTEVVARLDTWVSQVSVATALPEDLAVSAPDPAWAEPRRASMMLPIAGTIGVIGFVVWRWVRRDRRKPRSHPAQ